MPSPEPLKFLLVDDVDENLLALEGIAALLSTLACGDIS